MPGQLFYQHLAHLFYAIASADKKINEAEMKTLIQDVRSIWAPEEKSTDEFGEDTAFQIITVFDWLVENSIKSEKAWKDFESYYREHSSLFKPPLKEKIIKTSEKIAHSFRGKNKAEQKMLKKLKDLFHS